MWPELSNSQKSIFIIPSTMPSMIKKGHNKCNLVFLTKRIIKIWLQMTFDKELAENMPGEKKRHFKNEKIKSKHSREVVNFSFLCMHQEIL